MDKMQKKKSKLSNSIGQLQYFLDNFRFSYRYNMYLPAVFPPKAYAFKAAQVHVRSQTVLNI